MIKKYFACFVSFMFLFSAFAQEASTSSMKEIKSGSVFVKPALGGFFKLGSVDDNLSPSLEDHVRKLRSGFIWTLDGGVMISKSDYIGATFSRTNKSGSFSNTIFFPGGGSNSFSIDNSETIQYIGLHYGNMQSLGPKRNAFWHTRAGLGLFNYESNFSSNFSQDVNFKESNFGFQLGTGVEVRLGSSISWVADIDLLTGNVKIEDEKENLSQIRASTGLLFRF